MPFLRTALIRVRSRGPHRLEQRVSSVLGQVLLLAILGVAMGVTTALIRNAQFERVRNDVSASGALARAHAGMLDQETGLRAYVLTHERTFLEPYRRGGQEVVSGDQELERLLSGDKTLEAEYVKLWLAQRAWTLQWEVPARNQPATGPPAAFLVKGKRLLDRYRAAYHELDRVLNQRLAQVEKNATQVAYIGLFVELILAGLIVITWFRSRRRLQSSIVNPVTRILGSLDRVTDGDFARPEPVVEAPLELDAICRRISEMTDSLVAFRDTALQREADAQRQADRLRQIMEMARTIAGSLNLHYVLETVADNATSVLRDCRCIIWLIDPEQSVLRPAHDTAGSRGDAPAPTLAAMGYGTAERAAMLGRRIGHNSVRNNDGPRWTLALPMIVGARVVGVVELMASEALELEEGTLEVLEMLATHAATAVEAARLYEAAERESRTDALSGLPNRRQLDADLAREFERSKRYDHPLAFAMIDIDHFKRFNDRHGHQVGDEILQVVAATLADGVRATDTVYRYGGEEFALLFPESEVGDARIVCERLRAAVADRLADPGCTVTISAGVAVYSDENAQPRDLVEAADRALYTAKGAGRDRVELALEPMGTVVSINHARDRIA